MAISLQKGHKVSLEKKSPAGLGEIHVNLNWNSVPQNQGFIKSLFGGQQGIDLDLGCLYELKNSPGRRMYPWTGTTGQVRRLPGRI